jgi:hypothetical protein
MDVNRQIGTAAAFAQIVWVAIGVFLYVTTPATSLISLSAAAFFIGGLLAAAAIFGMGFYGLQRAIDSALVPAGDAPVAGRSQTISRLAWLLVIVEAVIIVVAATFAFRQIETYRIGVPLQYVQQRDNFDYALKAFALANKMEEDARPARESGQIDAELERRLVEVIEAGVTRGRTVTDEFLLYLHPELPGPYRMQLVHGYEMLAQGRRNGNLPMQTEGNDLVRKFYQEFLPPRADAILGKVGARLE